MRNTATYLQLSTDFAFNYRKIFVDQRLVPTPESVCNVRPRRFPICSRKYCSILSFIATGKAKAIINTIKINVYIALCHPRFDTCLIVVASMSKWAVFNYICLCYRSLTRTLYHIYMYIFKQTTLNVNTYTATK